MEKYECVCLQVRKMEGPNAFVNECVCSCICVCNDVWQCSHQFLHQCHKLMLQRHSCSFLLQFSFPSAFNGLFFYFPCMSKTIIHSKRLNYSDGKWPRIQRGGKRRRMERNDGTPLRIFLERGGEESKQSRGDLRSKKRWIEGRGELIYLQSSRYEK